ncbi:ABC transporter permease [Neisseriaceae bacterium JH1-16]|nr:ABC transporter permease [Neisseriaceae bacterium JH1-16]
MSQNISKFDPRGLVVPLLLIALWWASAHWGWADTRLVVPPLDVVAYAREQFVSGELALGLVASLARDLAGFAIGAGAGLVIGALLALSPLTDRLAGPSLHAVKQVALFAWIPLISVWFGQGEPAKLVFIALATFYPVLFNTYEGIKSVRRELAEVTRVFGFGRRQTLLRLVLPAASPQIFAGLHLGLIYSWLGTIGAEYYLKVAPGVSTPLIDGREHFEMARVLYGMVLIGLVGALLNAVATRLEQRTLRWRPR